MTPQQKTAALVVRIIGFIAVFVGAIGGVYCGLLEATGGHVETERVWSSVVFFIAGAIVIVAGGPIGKFLGDGLE